MSCSADTYVSLGGSNGCADQLTNWDGTQKLGLEAFHKRKKKGWGDKRTENSDKIDFIIFVTYP